MTYEDKADVIIFSVSMVLILIIVINFTLAISMAVVGF